MNRTLTWVLLFALVASVAGVGYLSMNSEPAGRTYTEFYILGPDGNASDYPTELNISEEAAVIVGVTNHERETVDYRVEIAWNETVTGEREMRLAHGETREFAVTLTAPAEPGVYQLRFLVLRADGGSEQLSDPLFLRVTVTE